MNRHWRSTQIALGVGGAVLLVLVGGGIVALLYGPGAALIAVSFVAVVAGLGALIWLLLTIAQRWADRES
jgi:hypothetical protein